jgi:hypothetical protein
MKLALIYDPTFPKLTAKAYSQTYRDMFLALKDRYEECQEITDNCSAQDIEADHIVFFDIHSAHDITIDGIEKHAAIKFEYFNDPYQPDAEGQYKGGPKFRKLGPKARAQRANERGVKYVICPQENMYYRHIAPHFGGELIWFPPCPRPRLKCVPLLTDRQDKVLANGHCWPGTPGFRPYQFRKWAFQQEGVEYLEHSSVSTTPGGEDFQSLLASYAGALACCDTHIVPKHVEVPMVGCVCFTQYRYEYENMGFQDGESCVYVTKQNFHDAIELFLKSPEDYQEIADAGRKLVMDHWTASHFAERVYSAK